MNNSKLSTLKHEILPIKELPSEEARTEAILHLGVWLDGMLSLDGEKSVRRLEILLPIVRDEAWGFSVKEIKEAFTMYVKSELMYNQKVIEPRDNFLTVILFNKVIKAYREQRKPKKQGDKMTAEEIKALNDYMYVINLFDYFVQNNKVPVDCQWVYDYLESRVEDFRFSISEKKILMRLGKEQKLSKKESAEKSKRVLLMRYFNQIQAKGFHIKDKLNNHG